MIGPGKYDDICTMAREQAKAKSVILIINDGCKGSGFSCQADISTLLTLPAALRGVADQIEANLKEGLL